MNPARVLLSVLVVLSVGSAACAGEDGPSPAAAKAEPLVALVEDRVVPDDGLWVGRCLDPVLPLDATGAPDCVVLLSRALAADSRPVACERCDAPGTRIPDAATLARATLPEGSGDGCFCELLPSAPDPTLREKFEGEPATAGWWYTAGTAPRRCPNERFHGDLMISRDASLGPGPLTASITCYAR